MPIEESTVEIDYELVNQNDHNVLLLPFSVDSDFKGSKAVIYHKSTLSVQKKLAQNGVESNLAVGAAEDSVFLENRSVDWFGPTLFFSISLLTQNQNIVSVCLNVLSNYIYDIFKGRSEDPSVRCSFVFEDEKEKRKVNYEGPVSGLKEVEKIYNGKKK